MPAGITMKCSVVRPWGCLSLPGFCEASLNSAVTLHRAAGSSSGTGIIQTRAVSSAGYRQRQETKV